MSLRLTNTDPANIESKFAQHKFVSIHLPSGWWLFERREAPEKLSIPVNFFLWEASELDNIEDPLDVLEFLDRWGRPFQKGAQDLSESESDRAYSMAVKGNYIQPNCSSLLDARLKAANELANLPDVLARHSVNLLSVEELALRLTVHTEVIVRLQTMSEMSKAIQKYLRFSEETPLAKELHLLNSALSLYSPRILSDETQDDDEPNVYSELALQMFQVLSSGTTLKICHNETCQREFVFQRGRSVSTSHRSTDATKYCSHKCGKLQTQRERRQKTRESLDYD
jgi:hypothetical protein